MIHRLLRPQECRLNSPDSRYPRKVSKQLLHHFETRPRLHGLPSLSSLPVSAAVVVFLDPDAPLLSGFASASSSIVEDKCCFVTVGIGDELLASRDGIVFFYKEKKSRQYGRKKVGKVFAH